MIHGHLDRIVVKPNGEIHQALYARATSLTQGKVKFKYKVNFVKFAARWRNGSTGIDYTGNMDRKWK